MPYSVYYSRSIIVSFTIVIGSLIPHTNSTADYAVTIIS